MDRFKFRVWNKRYSKYHYDAEMTFEENKVLGIDYFGQYLDDDDFVVEQCTGLKDKNDKLIYEGDIVEFYSYSYIEAISGKSMKRRVGIVIWNDEWLKFDITVNGEAIPDLCKKTDDNQFVIIGNIHENKDLLEGKNENK